MSAVSVVRHQDKSFILKTSIIFHEMLTIELQRNYNILKLPVWCVKHAVQYLWLCYDDTTITIMPLTPSYSRKYKEYVYGIC